MLSTDERRARLIARSLGTPPPPMNGTVASAPRSNGRVLKVENVLRDRLRKQFGIGCTACFDVTLRTIKDLSIAEIRGLSHGLGQALRENAHEMEAVKKRKDGRKLIEWAKEHGGEVAYQSLILDACDVCDANMIPAGAIVMNADKHGFGDAMITAWISEGSKGTDTPLVHYATGQKAALLRLFGQVVIDLPQPNMRDTFAPGGREAAGMHVTRLQHRAEYLQAGGTPKRPQLIALSPGALDFAAKVADDNTIPLFPLAAHPIRIWPAAYWLELARLLTDAGWKPLFLLDRDVPPFYSSNRQVGLSWEYEVAIVQRTRLAITNSSGPAHVLGTMGHPTLVVCGPTDPHVAFGHLDSLRCLYEESMTCVRCHYRPPQARPACWVGCEALHRLSPTTVLAEAIKILGREPLHEVAPGMWRQVSGDRVKYDDAYFDRFDGYRETAIHRQLIAARVALVRKYECESAIDVGIGAGTFVEAMDCDGYDVMPKAVEWLNSRSKFRSPYAIVSDAPDALTCWDSLEHIEHPEELLECVRPGKYLFVSLPVFRDLADIQSSKHYRPGEHLTYWTADGLVQWAASHGLTLIERNEMETELGRESIGTFVFKRPDIQATSKTAYVIAGPTSSGNRLLASILIRSGCAGVATTEQPTTADEIQRSEGPLAIIHHEDLSSFIPMLRTKGYERIIVLVVVREPVANLSSEVKRGHSDNYREARQQRSRLIAENMVDALANNVELEVVTYEGFTEPALREWLPMIGLPYVDGPLILEGQDAPATISNQNNMHYREAGDEQGTG